MTDQLQPATATEHSMEDKSGATRVTPSTPHSEQAQRFSTPFAAIVADESKDGFPGRLRVIVVNLDGTVIPVTESIDYFEGAYHFAWSPGGDRLLVSVDTANSDGSDLYIMNADGSESERIETSLVGGASFSHATWSPDGKQIAFQQSGAPRSYIHIANQDGSDARLLTEGRAPSWSPDGQWIAFERPRSIQDRGGDIYIIQVNGHGMRQLTSGENLSLPSWSPDGKWIASSSSDAIHVISPEDMTSLELSPTGLAPSWTKDSRQIVVAHDTEIVLVNVDGTGFEPMTDVPDLIYVSASFQPIPFDE
jgi:Tol biopolymer transport system component